MRRLSEPSHLDLRCLTFSLSTLHINVFPNDSLLKYKNADDKCRLKFGAKRVNKEAKCVLSILLNDGVCLYDVLVILEHLATSSNNSSRNVRKRTFWHVRPPKTQISLCIRAVWSESSMFAWIHPASLSVQNAPIEDYDKTVWMHRLIWIFARRTCPMVRFLTFRLISW